MKHNYTLSEEFFHSLPYNDKNNNNNISLSYNHTYQSRIHRTYNKLSSIQIYLDDMLTTRYSTLIIKL